MAEGEGQRLSSAQALEAAHRFVTRYYQHERTMPILQLLEAISSSRDDPDSKEHPWADWRVCVQETLDGTPMPDVPRPWDY
ncbi:MAG: hypothetical protein M3083_19890 [Actinomycetota bacterium]|nr:hypothetical protein [Actinomycetota bacterium]